MIKRFGLLRQVAFGPEGCPINSSKRAGDSQEARRWANMLPATPCGAFMRCWLRHRRKA
jgi:hypothetical protein